MDRIDQKILQELQADARLSIVELSRRVGLTKTPCAERVRRLEKAGVIRGYHAALDRAREAAKAACDKIGTTGKGIGLFISGSNVRIPAHYHGCIVGVTLALMGLVYHLLPQLGYAAPASRLATLQPRLYGFGQLMHIVGLVWSGGYGVQRKVAGAEQVLHSTAEVAGMGLMGLGGLIAIIGGLLFVVVVAKSLRQPVVRHGVAV